MNPPAPAPESILEGLPSELGFHMPAEWERQQAVWLSWPANTITWPGEMLERVRKTYLEMMDRLLCSQQVKLLVGDEVEADRVRNDLRDRGHDLERLIIYLRPTVDAWIRDYGPTFLLGPEGRKAWIKWIFNAWGNKYASLARDTGVFEKPGNFLPLPSFRPGIVLEGGSIEVNGAGVCMTTEQCLLNPNRNPSLSREQIEQLLKDMLAVEQILWLGEGVDGDDTDGHIDDIARFVSPDTILLVREDNASDPNFAVLEENRRRLLEAREAGPVRWNVIDLPMPAPVRAEGVRLPASYANFYIGNGCVLLPVFKDPKDDEAAAILREHFPGRDIVPVDCRDLVYGLGAIHCVSQQEPEGS